MEKYNAFIQKQIQLPWSDVCPLESRLDKEIEELWRLMLKHSRGMYSGQKKEMNCLNSLIEEEVTGKCNGRLQHKVWKHGKLRLELKCNGSEYNGKFQYKVWKPGDWA
jgi:hypothetical protein